ncbi:MAG: FHA domain-containing protein, partial [Planctomycetes bacterium]|nr:FHA domain-containing protein [Planctomycetota bacterium]
MAQLHVNQLKSKGKRRLDDDSITIGRSTQNGLVLAHSSVSREHCLIEITDGVARIRDLHSTHGTKIKVQTTTESVRFD